MHAIQLNYCTFDMVSIVKQYYAVLFFTSKPFWYAGSSECAVLINSIHQQTDD